MTEVTRQLPQLNRSLRQVVVANFRCTLNVYMPDDLHSAINSLCIRGLIVIESDDRSELIVARPRSAAGTEFPISDCGDVVSGIYSTYILTDVPVATVRQDAGHWIVEISDGAAPGPGPIYYRNKFRSAQDAATAVIDCYFGDRIDFTRADLAPWIDRN